MLRPLLLLLLLACFATPPALAALPPGAAAEISFDGARQVLSVPWFEGVPAVSEREQPPRLVIEVPWTARMVEGQWDQVGGRVASIRVARKGLMAAIEVRLRRPLKGEWAASASPGRLLVRVGPALRVAPTKPSPRASVIPTALPAVPAPSVSPLRRSPPGPSPLPARRATPAPSVVPARRVAPSPTPRSTSRPQPAPSGLTTPRPAPAGATSAGEPAEIGRFTFREELGIFLLPFKGRLQPEFSEFEAPPRLVVDLANARVKADEIRVLTGALVKEVRVTELAPEQVQIVFNLTQPLGKRWRWKQTGNRLMVRFDAPGMPQEDSTPAAAEFKPVPAIQAPTAGQSPQPPAPTPVLTAAPTPEARQTAKPAPPTPEARPTPKPAPPTPEARLTPKPAPPTPEARPTPKPVSPTPEARPTPKPASPTPEARLTPKPATPEAPRSAPTAKPSTVPAAGKPPSQLARAPESRGHAFTGTVYNINSGAPLAGVRVVAGDRQTLTDRDGHFSLQSLPPGPLAVSVTAPGFSSQRFSIVVPEDQSISLNLVPSL